MSATTMCDFLEALLDAAGPALLALTPRVVTYDGQPVGSEPTDYLAIGWQSDNDDTQASGESGWRAVSRALEGGYEIPCEISVSYGDTTIRVARRRAQTIENALWATLLPTGARGNATALQVPGVLGCRLDTRLIKSRKDPSIGTVIAWQFAIQVHEYITSS